MAYSAATYKGDGSQSTFIIPFDYLQKDFVKVTINEVDKVYAQDYNVDGRELSFPTAPPSGSIIKIYRETPTDRMVKWNEGSVLTSSNMTTQQIQELHLIEETTYNLENSAMVKTEDNGHKWEGQYLPITHVGDPTDDSDVVNLGMIKKEETGFLASVRSQLDKWLADLGTTYNNYSKSLKESFDSHTSSLKNQFDTYTASLLNDFNAYKDTLKTNYDSYASTLLSKYNEYLASLTATKDAVKDSEANTSKYKDEAKSFSDSAKTSEVNAKTSEVAAAESAKQAAAGQINADWNETNANSKAFIKNKPNVILKSDLAYSVTTNTLTATDAFFTDAIFTGQTSVPTANEGNSSNTIASTEFVAKSLAKLVDSAPETMNTLNELAKALGNDPNFATTIINELGKKMNSVEAESTFAKKEEAGVLSGTVMAFSGTFKDGYPIDKNTGLSDKKWHLCDGTNGTPDLRNKFIYGGNGTNNGTTGGEASHKLTEAELPALSGEAGLYIRYNTGQTASGILKQSYNTTSKFPSATSENCTSSVVKIAFGDGQPHNNMPPYYVLAYIMKL